MQSSSLEFLTSLIAAPSPSGYEQPVARLYRDYTAPFADQVTTDVAGNVMAALNPDAPMRVMLAGHMDEIGFIIYHIGDDGLLYFSAFGGHDSTTPLGQRVWVHGKERVAGVVGRKAIHLLDPDELNRKPKMQELWIDIGASSRGQAEAVFQISDFLTYQYEFQMQLDVRAMARANFGEPAHHLGRGTLHLCIRASERRLNPGLVRQSSTCAYAPDPERSSSIAQRTDQGPSRPCSLST